MQAIILAAGMGKRLKELTSEATKCMVKVNGVSMIERMLTILDKRNLNRIVMVVGYQGEKLINYINSLEIHTPIEYVWNNVYNKTNNIYSLYLAREYMLEDDTLLLESDLIFDGRILDYLFDNPYPNLALVAKFESWMDGTVIELGPEGEIRRFLSKKEFRFDDIPHYYKTVNIYKFSKAFSTTHYVPFLEAYSKALGNNEYYEQVLKVIALLDKPDLKAVPISHESWYEIDDVQDLNIAESIFAVNKEEKLKKFQARYGGYWRYPHMLDFCYLVNPFFPSPKLMAEMKANFERLMFDYPSGMDVNALLMAKYYGLHKENVVVGNGAAELIKSLMSLLDGKLGVIYPTFEEYPHRKPSQELVAFIPQNADFSYTADDLMTFFRDKEIATLALINPDNPSGNFLSKQEVVSLVDFAGQKGIRLIVDESFLDFAENGLEQSLLDQEFLVEHPHVLVIKSISKSFGVPGLRLGLMASGDEALVGRMKKDVAIWNINSFAEFFMQIWEKYASDYRKAMARFQEVRQDFLEKLAGLPNLRIVPTQANFVMCEVLAPHSAKALAEDLLDGYGILIKDLSSKTGFDGRAYIRLAIRDQEDNDRIICALQALLAC
jgi:histidinol-phosphate/aromatic aminotransferase/cobyric acid decarboxylase-like protein/choline kinase